ncbi:hypothetical protein PTSG_01423 [Salpingoeca rosetta]|uniref:FAD-binding 8 domain-containing protein n=1 Tax=Salpingoeca rosetta (strain ATCC 50818 / BSB-021) TaxID=946362 RepID=F2U0A9_SALR5|nr:uncharacterized protein PTSG_01423 [Salpingoeca rosetta]EGD80837.1 hypothetical protein PTSG_01423 [Salpingoeca rosetta]|eukprot:XP_004997398.1 hypothetical protein PTSG_01423 [Salpingoeca rosetta]
MMMTGPRMWGAAALLLVAAFATMTIDSAAAQQDSFSCAPRNYSDPCLSVPTLTNGDFQRFHAGILTAVFLILGALFTYRLIYNFRVVPWRQSSVFFTCVLACIFHVVWLSKDAKNIQHPLLGLPYEGLADLTFTIVICCLFGYMMKLDDEIRQNRVHWRIVVQWIFLVTAAILQVIKIYTARQDQPRSNVWISFISSLLLSLTTADRCLLLMKLLPPTQRSTHTWFRKVNFLTFFISVCLFMNSAIIFAHAIDEEIKVASRDRSHTYACFYVFEFLSVRTVALVVAPLMVILTGLWDDPRTILAVKRLESRKSQSITSRVDAFINRYWRTMAFILVISLITLGLAGWGGSATCYAPHAQVVRISLFMARVGATPFYILFPAVFVMVLNGFNTSLESSMLGSFLPRANGSLVIYHKYVGWLCVITMLFHIGGHIGTLFAYHRFISDLATNPTKQAIVDQISKDRPAVLEYFSDIYHFRGGPWMLPWFTGVFMTACMIAVVAVYYVLAKRKHKRFKKWHVWAAYSMLAVGSIHGAGRVLGDPYLWVVFLVVAGISILDFLWCRRRSEKVRCEMWELTTPGARGRVEVVLILRFRCKKIKFFPGDYLLLRVPQISVSDQHPFTIVTNVPEDEYELHIKVSDLKVNAWTRALTAMLDFKYGRIMAGHSYQANRSASEEAEQQESSLEQRLLSNQEGGMSGLLDDVKCNVDAVVIGGFKSSLADSDFINGDFVLMVGFSVGATPMCAYLNRLPESRFEELRDNIWFFHRSEFYNKPDGQTVFGAYGGYIREVCQETEKRIGRDPNGPAGPILQAEAGERRDVFWNRLHSRVAECLQKLPQGGRVHIGYCGSLRGLDSLYDALDKGQLAANRAVKFYIESFG